MGTVDLAAVLDAWPECARVLTPADAEAIRAYVIERSNWTKANLPEATAPVGR